MIGLAGCLLWGALVTAPTGQTRPAADALPDFLRTADAAFQYRSEDPMGKASRFRMTSQKWQGTTWEHSILYRTPEVPLAAPNTAVLFITGDGPRGNDAIDLELIAGGSRLPVAMLFDIPNQPLWDMREDDLIAHTFERYLATKDRTWPLLFPMTKAAIRAMDTIVATTKDSPNPIRQFVVTGASKRGWTTWLVGASGDPRVKGIAPMVYDNLNLTRQMPWQLKSWGQYSLMIQDYTKRGLQAKMETPEGRVLSDMVDPYTYRRRIRVPILVVNGANDPYWTVDATQFYLPAFGRQARLLTVPNAGHGLGNRLQAAASIGAFARRVADHGNLPEVYARLRRNGSQVRMDLSATPTSADSLQETLLWVATATNRDFRAATYRQTSLQNPITREARTQTIEVPAADRNWAAFVEFRFRADGQTYSLTSPTQVLMRPESR